MEEMNKAYATFEERDRIASLGGGVDKIEKQHESGKMTARERIEMLLDKGTYVELDKLMVHRCTNYGMDKNKIPGDGIVSGYGKVDGRQVFVYAYDFTGKAFDTFLNTCAARIIQSDNRGTVLQRKLLYFHNLFGIGSRQ